MGELGGIALEEMSPSGKIEKEIAHGEVAAHLASDGSLFNDLGGFNLKADAHFVIRTSRLEFDLRHRRYGGEGLATETHGVKVVEVLGSRYFGRGMTFERHAGIGFGHTLAIINDLDERATGIPDEDLNLGSTGVNSVLDQFLDNGGGAVNHLASGYLIGDAIGQQVNDVRHRSTFEFRTVKESVVRDFNGGGHGDRGEVGTASEGTGRNLLECGRKHHLPQTGEIKRAPAQFAKILGTIELLNVGHVETVITYFSDTFGQEDILKECASLESGRTHGAERITHDRDPAQTLATGESAVANGRNKIGGS